MEDIRAVLDIARVLKSGAEAEEFSFKVDLSSVDEKFSDVTFSGKLRNIAGVVTIKSTVTGTYNGVCDRCLAAAVYKLSAKIDTIVTADASRDDSVSVQSCRIDLVKTAYDALSLELPMILLCKEDCRGICPSCGADLNDGPCKCDC